MPALPGWAPAMAPSGGAEAPPYRAVAAACPSWAQTIRGAERASTYTHTRFPDDSVAAIRVYAAACS